MSRSAGARSCASVTRLVSTPTPWCGSAPMPGGGRQEYPVSAAAGVICPAKRGGRVPGGQPLLELRRDDRARFTRALEGRDSAIKIGAEPPVIGPPVLERIA